MNILHGMLEYFSLIRENVEDKRVGLQSVNSQDFKYLVFKIPYFFHRSHEPFLKYLSVKSSPGEGRRIKNKEWWSIERQEKTESKKPEAGRQIIQFFSKSSAYSTASSKLMARPSSSY